MTSVCWHEGQSYSQLGSQTAEEDRGVTGVGRGAGVGGGHNNPDACWRRWTERSHQLKCGLLSNPCPRCVPDFICLTVASPGSLDWSSDFDLWPLTPARHFCPHGCRSPAIIACFVGRALHTQKMVVSVWKSRRIPADSDLQPVWQQGPCWNPLQSHCLSYCHATFIFIFTSLPSRQVLRCRFVIGCSAAERVWWSSRLQ